jgi:hypothetical protein
MYQSTARRFFRPGFEILEERWTPTITPFDCDPAVGGNDSVRIFGTSGVDRVVVTDDPDADSITYQHDVGNNGSIDFTLTTSTFDFCVEVDLRAGNDILIYNVESDYSSSVKQLSVFLGTGNDRVTFNTNGFDITAGSEWIIEITDPPTAGGADRVFLDFASATTNGTDTNIVDSAVTVTVDLGTGADRAVVNFDGDIGNGAGTADTTVDLFFALGSQDDRFTGQFDLNFFDVFNDGELALQVGGGGGNDVLRLQRHPDFAPLGAASIDGKLDVILQGAAGNDIIDCNFAMATVNAFTSSQLGHIDLRVYGDTGNDNIEVSLSNDQFATLNYDVVVRGGAAADTMGLSFESASGSTITFNALGYALLDGGLGPDLLSFSQGNVRRRSF